ncbi:putative transporter [Fonsecaea pedrosoi]|nr:putative transporter [Fonsecaea pedrosoi]
MSNERASSPSPDADKFQNEAVILEDVPSDGAPRKDLDVAAQFLATLDTSVAQDPVSPQEERRVLWKIDLTILPLILVTVVLAAIDKVIISNAAIYGMSEDTNLEGNQFSWVGSLFYFGYLVAEYPAAILIQRLPLGKFFAITIMGWAVMMLCTAATNSFGSLAAVRFLMGMMEAFVFPVSSIMTVMWWRKKEQPIRVAFWFNSLSTVFSGIVSYGIGHTNTALHPWRLLFLVLGGFSVLWAIVIFIFLPSSPVDCWYLSEREKYVCLYRVRENNTGVEDKKVKWYQVRECLTDPKTWLLAIFAIAQNIPNSGIVTFAAIIVRGMGYSPIKTVVIGIPTGIIATVWQILLSIIQSYLPNTRCAFIAGGDMVTLASAVMLWKFDSDNRSGLLGAYYLFYTYWAPYVLATSLPMANTSGHSEKLTMNAVFFISYCVGCILGPQTFRSNDAPTYSRGFEGQMACFVVAIAAISAYGFLCYLENKRRDRQELGTASVSDSNLTQTSFSDLTDFEKKEFRYTY